MRIYTCFIRKINKDQINKPYSWVVRKLMDMSPGLLQNLRVTRKVRFKKVLGSYYYNKEDLSNLFSEN